MLTLRAEPTSQNHLLTALSLVTALMLALPARAEDSYAAATRLYQSHQYAAAAGQFSIAFETHKSNYAACYYAAYSFYLAGDRKRSADLFKQFVRSFPQRPECKNALAILKTLEPHSETAETADKADPARPAQSAKLTNATGEETAAQIANQLIQVLPPKGKIPAVSSKFTADITDLLGTIPVAVLRLLRDRGCHIILTSSVVETDYRIQNTVPRGWDSSSSWKDSPAMCTGKDVVISAYRLDSGGQDYVSTTGEYGVVRHEIGHAVDYVLGEISQSEAFKHAFFLDLARIPHELDGQLGYFMQKGGSGASETFAELCCYKFGGETDEGRKQSCELVNKHFKLCKAELQKCLSQL